MFRCLIELLSSRTLYTYIYMIQMEFQVSNLYASSYLKSCSTSNFRNVIPLYLYICTMYMFQINRFHTSTIPQFLLDLCFIINSRLFTNNQTSIFTHQSLKSHIFFCCLFFSQFEKSKTDLKGFSFHKKHDDIYPHTSGLLFNKTVCYTPTTPDLSVQKK